MAMTWIKKLEWMTDAEYENIRFYFGCVCNYEMTWEDEADYERWCARVLNDTPRFQKDWKD